MRVEGSGPNSGQSSPTASARAPLLHNAAAPADRRPQWAPYGGEDGAPSPEDGPATAEDTLGGGGAVVGGPPPQIAHRKLLLLPPPPPTNSARRGGGVCGGGMRIRWSGRDFLRLWGGGGGRRSSLLPRSWRRWRCLHKRVTVLQCVFILVIFVIFSTLLLVKYVSTSPLTSLIRRDSRPEPSIRCAAGGSGGGDHAGRHAASGSPQLIQQILRGVGRGSSMSPVVMGAAGADRRSAAWLRIDPKVLVFVETTYSRLGREITELLVYNRIKYKVEVSGKSLPVLTNLDKGRYGVVVFENVGKYLKMDKWNRELLDKYCREYSVGLIGFNPPSEETLVGAQLRGFPLFLHTNLRLRDAALNAASPVLRLTRAGETVRGPLVGEDWSVFSPNHSTYEAVAWAVRDWGPEGPHHGVSGAEESDPKQPLITVIQDHGRLDGIERVLFGSGLRFWLHKLLFLDALSYLSHDQLSVSLTRYLLIDVDDIFVGERGTRLTRDDVQALLATQKRMQQMVPGFRFNLGFSGKYFHHGTAEENLGDDMLLENADQFLWFGHMWNHQQPHLYDNITQLEIDMTLNRNFAKEHGIPVDSGYSIAPHHSGVYPVHEPLYEAWKRVWGVRATSTEEYPHLRPARLRRGFIHRNIMVLPRQTCGLFTHTILIERYPGGRAKLDEAIQGGELFQTLAFNPINVFMTHMSNYGNDRLALYTFESVVKFLRCWTNLKLTSAPPLQLGERYFQMYPEEADPVWGNPCEDVRHQRIWSRNKTCEQLPRFLVIGPQKTGTTALYTFLSMHPDISSNFPSPDTFEEIQFFNGKNYYRGLDWYMSFFPVPKNSTARYLFEKSATYFDGDLVPKRVHALLPHAKLVTILISPSRRAYSWYQHMRAHGDAVAKNYTFYEVVTATDTAPKNLRELRNRCLNPGKYSQHLERWLSYFPPQQLHIIDGDTLRSNPVEVMNDLQRFLKIVPPFDYSAHLRYDPKKGFFCQVTNGDHTKCLGRSKGRQYPPMDERAYKLLQRYYLTHNTALVKLLKRLGGRHVPQWLKDDLSDTVVAA
ncbi:bifunctional heparan sulfate N-deacetylase/N-sulfotransferase isoform X2 [Ischnura elegans]|uniref:bifunctional heparan sulfate N-deacetylase/N-sulfotransferase isoform X2 n=1 Tax=Ischnura elegans TaxID=197161 RepID=UPI001ED8ADC3|nr:bifunctional heparan sulfate N-deacetylase/N-sulfotransferase isoform X2 [Ischnura elegans]